MYLMIVYHCCISIFLGICAIFIHRKCVVLRKSACPFGQVKTIMYLLESPFFKNSLAEASGLVLMSNPELNITVFKAVAACMHSR